MVIGFGAFAVAVDIRLDNSAVEGSIVVAENSGCSVFDTDPQY